MAHSVCSVVDGQETVLLKLDRTQGDVHSLDTHAHAHTHTHTHTHKLGLEPTGQQCVVCFIDLTEHIPTGNTCSALAEKISGGSLSTTHAFDK